MKSSRWTEWFGEALTIRGCSPRTVKGYVGEVRLFFQFLEDRSVTALHEIRREEVDAYRVHLHQRRKPNGDPLALSTQAVKLTAILSFLRYLHEEQFLLVNPAQGVKLPKVPKVLPTGRLLGEDQVRRVLEQPDMKTPHGFRDRLILEFFYGLGLRRRECHRLDLDDLDCAHRLVKVQGKGQRERILPLNPALWSLLEVYLRRGRAQLRPYPDELALWIAPQTGRRLGYGMLRQLGHSRLSSTQHYTEIRPLELHREFARCHPRARLISEEEDEP